MPHVSPLARDVLVTGDPATSGELAYAIAALIHKYVGRKGHSWDTFSGVYGALEGTKREFQRCLVDPYEAEKQKANHSPLFKYTPDDPF